MKKLIQSMSETQTKTGNFILLTLCIFFTVNLLMIACKKEQVEAITYQSVSVPKLTGVTFESGLLKFASKQDYEHSKETMLKYKNSIREFEKQFNGFVSSRTAYFQKVQAEENLSVENLPEFMFALKMSDGEVYVRPSVDFHIIGYLANTNGILQVGNEVFKYTYENVFKTSAENINILLTSTDLKNDPNVEVLPIDRIEQDVVLERNELAECEWFYDVEGKSRKFHCEVKSRIYPGYSQLSVDMDHYRRRFGIWVLDDAPSMSFSGTLRSDCCRGGDGMFNVCCPTVGGNACTASASGICIYSTSASGTNEGEIFDVIMDNNSGGHFSLGTPTNILFTGKGDNGDTRSCSIIK